MLHSERSLGDTDGSAARSGRATSTPKPFRTEHGLRAHAPPRVLLADDDDAMRDMVARALRRAGYEVIESANGTQLAQIMRGFVQSGSCQTPPDLVISDIRMPGMSGLEVLGALRRSNSFMPVILVTGFGDAETHAEARRLGATRVLDKPFDIAELLRVSSLLAPIA